MSRIRTRASSPRVARVIAGSISPARTRARAAAAALARSLDCAHAVWRWRWRWRSVTSCATRVTHVTRVAHHARRSSRARTRTSSPLRTRHYRFRPPRVRPARARCCGGGARSIARSLDRAHTVWRWRWRWRSVTPHATCVTRARTRHHRASRASSPPPSPMLTMRARGVRSRSLICCCVRRHAAHRTCARDLGALVSATPLCMTPHPLCNTHGTHATHNMTRRRRRRQHDDDDPRACSGGGGARSLARSLARARARAVAVAIAVAIAAYDARAFDDACAMSHSRVGFVMMRERSARWPT